MSSCRMLSSRGSTSPTVRWTNWESACDGSTVTTEVAFHTLGRVMTKAVPRTSTAPAPAITTRGLRHTARATSSAVSPRSIPSAPSEGIHDETHRHDVPDDGDLRRVHTAHLIDAVVGGLRRHVPVEPPLHA